MMKILPYKGKLRPFNKLFAEREPYEKRFLQEKDRVGVELYLAMLAKAASMEMRWFYNFENLYFDEYDLKSIDVKKILFGHIDLVFERNSFLKYINTITIRIFQIFEKIFNKYNGKISTIKLSGVQSNFQ